jgi:hypothetical protein
MTNDISTVAVPLSAFVFIIRHALFNHHAGCDALAIKENEEKMPLSMHA